MEKTYSIINTTDLTSIDFSQVYETNQNTIVKSIDESKFVIKYITEPSFITNKTVTPVQTLTHSEVLELLATPAWNQLTP